MLLFVTIFRFFIWSIIGFVAMHCGILQSLFGFLFLLRDRFLLGSRIISLILIFLWLNFVPAISLINLPILLPLQVLFLLSLTNLFTTLPLSISFFFKFFIQLYFLDFLLLNPFLKSINIKLSTYAANLSANWPRIIFLIKPIWSEISPYLEHPITYSLFIYKLLAFFHSFILVLEDFFPLLSFLLYLNIKFLLQSSWKSSLLLIIRVCLALFYFSYIFSYLLTFYSNVM